MLRQIKECENVNITKTDAILAGDCLSHSKRHEWLIGEVVDDFLNCLASLPNSKWTNMLQLVPFEGLTGEISAPKILVFIGGTRSTLKCQMANKALIDWQAITGKKTSARNTSFNWYQPVTQNQRLRTFFSTVDKEFDWNYQITDFTFKGGVKGFMSTLYVKRLKLHGQVRS